MSVVPLPAQPTNDTAMLASPPPVLRTIMELVATADGPVELADLTAALLDRLPGTVDKYDIEDGVCSMAAAGWLRRVNPDDLGDRRFAPGPLADLLAVQADNDEVFWESRAERRARTQRVLRP